MESVHLVGFSYVEVAIHAERGGSWRWQPERERRARGGGRLRTVQVGLNKLVKMSWRVGLVELEMVGARRGRIELEWGGRRGTS